MHFDPYYQWLGIPAKDQPANHYRLLGVELFEDNLDVIERASDRQTFHVQKYQTGQHAQHAARLLCELDAARLCLLDVNQKQKYDEQLRTESGDVDESLDDLLPPRVSPSTGPDQPAIVQPNRIGTSDGRVGIQPALEIRGTSVGRLRRTQVPLWKQPSLRWLAAGTVAVLLIVALVTFLARDQ